MFSIIFENQNKYFVQHSTKQCLNYISNQSTIKIYYITILFYGEHTYTYSYYEWNVSKIQITID